MQGTAVIFGATGLVGSACLDHLLLVERYRRVIAIGRREPARSDPKLVVYRASLDDLDALEGESVDRVDDVFCCLGTTIAKAGSQHAFRRVDLDYVVNAAAFAKHRGAGNFLLVTAVGANSESRVFYSRVKGEVEDAVAKLGIVSVSIFRPSLILGDRAESRWSARLAKFGAGALSFAMVGPLTKYRPIDAATVAQAMLAAAEASTPGFMIYEFDQMASLSRRNA